MTTVETSYDLHFADLQKLRPFEVYVDATENYLIISMAGSRQIVANCRDGRVNAYLICAVLNTAVHPDVLAALTEATAELIYLRLYGKDGALWSANDSKDVWREKARAELAKATGAA